MKIRNGFVSNSSSSSFIIGLKDIPKSYEHFKVMILGDDADYPVVSHFGDAYATDIILTRLYNDFMSKIELKQNDNLSDFTQDLKNNIRYTLNEYKMYVIDDDLDEFDRLQLLLKQNDEKTNTIWRQLKSDAYNNSEFKKIRSISDKYYDQIYELISKGLKSRYKDNKVIFDITYSDNNGEIDSFIEHSDILNNVTLLYFNNH